MNEKWLVISNCQTLGLANSLSLLCSGIDVDACDIWRFKNEIEIWKPKLAGYHQIIIHPEIQTLGLVDFKKISNVTWVPGILFRGFHPDLCFVFHDKIQVSTPMKAYSSVIAFAAFKSGLTLSQTKNLFREDVFQRLGFFDAWNEEKNNLLKIFDQYELDLRTNLITLIRSGGVFMHTINHPSIHAVFDLAKVIANKIRGSHQILNIIPHDNLAHGTIWPVYPSIAERIGIKNGNYLFKPPMAYSTIGLDEFLEGSLLAYQNYPIEQLRCNSPHYERAMKYIAEEL